MSLSCSGELAHGKALEERAGFDTDVTGKGDLSRPVSQELARWLMVLGRGDMHAKVWYQGLTSVEQRTSDFPHPRFWRHEIDIAMS